MIAFLVIASDRLVALLDRAIELGGEGLPGASLGLRFIPCAKVLSMLLKEPDIGGVARAPRLGGIEGE